LWLDFTWELHDNSDHWSFLERRIPIVLLHTGLHRDYHRPSDDVHKINRDGLLAVSQYLLGAILKVADADRLPTYRQRVHREPLSRQATFERPLPKASLKSWPSDTPPPRLGISWREDEAEPGSVFLTRVVDGTPAARAGLAVHDRIYELNAQPFPNAAAFQSAILALLDSNPAEIPLLIERRGDLRTITVKMQTSQESRVESLEPEAATR
jgi:predicted metalloprotease with PDZ domain